MLVVVDFNVVFSALVSKGVSLEVFAKNRVLGKLEFVAPGYIHEEFLKDKYKLLELTRLSKEEFEKFFNLIKSQIKIVSESRFVDKLEQAESVNPKDAPYIALALKMGCPIFSGDKELKEQSVVKVLSPRELLEMLE